MKKGLDKFIKVYMEILYALSSVFYAGFCFCVLVQVISRNFLPNAPSWTEELARYSFYLYGGLRRWSGGPEARVRQR